MDSKPASSKPSVSTTRRALLKAGWITPVVVAISLPRSSYADGMSLSRSFPERIRPLPPGPPFTPPGPPSGPPGKG